MYKGVDSCFYPWENKAVLECLNSWKIRVCLYAYISGKIRMHDIVCMLIFLDNKDMLITKK